jgi:hypothetical protein
MDETAGQRQFMAFIESMRPQSLGALQNYKAGERARELGIISEKEANENLIAAQRDFQAAQRVGNAKEILNAQMELQKAAQKLDEVLGQLAANAQTASNVMPAHELDARSREKVANIEANSRLQAAREKMHADHSLQEVAKIEERAQKNVKMMLDSDPTSGAKVMKDPGLVNRLVAQEIERVSNELQARRSGKPVSTPPPPAVGVPNPAYKYLGKE